MTLNSGAANQCYAIYDRSPVDVIPQKSPHDTSDATKTRIKQPDTVFSYTLQAANLDKACR